MNKEQLIETLSIMRDKLVEQGEVSSIKLWEGSEICSYRGKNGLKCGIGHVIADEDYKENMEGKTVRGVITDSAVKINGYYVDGLSGSIDVLDRAQMIHDYFLSMNIDKASFGNEIKERFDNLIEKIR